jgi:hypothetical protein
MRRSTELKLVIVEAKDMGGKVGWREL